jgi:DNA polymerase
MAARIKGDLEKYIQQQLDLGYDELYLPFDKPMPRGRELERTPGQWSQVVTTSTPDVTQVKAVDTSPRKRAKGPSGDEAPLPIERFAEARTLEQLERTIQDCKRCPLGKTRTKLVFGDGDPHADIMFVGEAPGRDEDLQGKPFVGRAGKLLNKMLEEIGLKREDVYIANILKSRPPDNRDPQPEEAEACEPYLHKQIELIQPKLICSLGRIAAQTLLRTRMPLKEMRGRWFEYRGAKFMVTYHPAAILRSMDNYSQGIEDLRRLVNELRRP